jgi:hypothetical protein
MKKGNSGLATALRYPLFEAILPAHVDAIFVPGIWVQAHHLDLDFYDKLFRRGYSETQRRHQALWH